MLNTRRHLWLAAITLCFTLRCAAANWNASATDLARQIGAIAGPGTISLSVTNNSSLAKDQVPEIQKAIEAQLRTSGIRIETGADSTSDVRVTLSENLQAYLWVAEIKQGNETRVTMISVPRGPVAPAPRTAPSMSIRKTLLWSQPTQILDAVVLNPSRLLVLDPVEATLYVINNGKWQPTQTWQMTRNHPLPRDLRGLIVLAKDHLADLYLPGTVCSVYAGASAALACHDGDDPWPIGTHSAFFNSGRNYFTGATIPAIEKSSSPFYSLVSLGKEGYALSLFAGIDGRLRVNDGVNELILPANLTFDWGSDLAVVKSNCGAGAQLLVTSAVDDSSTDTLRAFEIPDREPIQVSAPNDFPGPITSLWAHDPNTAMAIAHNLTTGQYEAYSVSITCNQ